MILLKPIHSTEKCFYDENIAEKAPLTAMTVFRGEQCSFQFACTADTAPGWSNAFPVRWSLDCALPWTLSSVELMPNREPIFHRKADESYLRTTPGLYPDLLRRLSPDKPYPVPYGGLTSLFCVLDIPEEADPGVYPVTLTFTQGDQTIANATVNVQVLPAVLPEQTLTVTHWFHCDCLASLYDVEIFSEEHWQIIENYVRVAVKTGTNAITTPVFTPPMDTEAGYERPTVQLVDMRLDRDGWHFGFDRLERWVEMCNRCGAAYFEISHLFYPRCDLIVPKVMATVVEEDGTETYRRVFPCFTDPRCDRYRDFLRAFLTAFLAKMKSLGGADKRCIFHISDEPYLDRLEIYRTLLSHVEDLIAGYRRIDAISDVEYYTEGLTTVPVPETMSIEPFLAADVPELWAYYCCDTIENTSNRFLSMSGDRMRIIGPQLWRWNIKGFLHWGFNFWYSCGSREVVNPYYITEGNYFGPAGDAFLVYPGKHGIPDESIRLHYFTEAMQDVRALQYAESLCGRETVEKLVDEYGTLTFRTLPDAPGYCHELRQKVNRLIIEHL
ncbi:MAG: DUF4091 domain-containing protein [Clostridia bacterium]|nr:DUF4091 domain-containing protein [Clostridia bacterium]